MSEHALPSWLVEHPGKAPADPHPHRFEVELEVVTPMFLAGADQQRIDKEGPRAASIKGMLRWWWRATATISDQRQLLQEEGRLFGDTESGQGAEIRVESMNWEVDTPQSDPVIGYLLGQGLYDHKKGGITRPAVKERSGFKLTINTADRDQSLIDAMEAFKLLGGMGARQRRGFGSISPVRSEAIADLSDYRSRLGRFFASRPRQSKAWSHLTTETRWVLIDEEFASWHTALSALGKPLLAYRQSLGGMKPPYEPDHDLVSDHVHKSTALHRSPRRAAFGIPHNYYFRKSKKKVDFLWDDNDRRASPLLLHIGRLGNGRYAAVAVKLNGPFLPANKRLKTKQTNARVPPPDLSAIDEYLDKL